MNIIDAGGFSLSVTEKTGQECFGSFEANKCHLVTLTQGRVASEQDDI